MSCEFCTDPDGDSCFPLYGLAPHYHPSEGGTILLEQQEADGFTPDKNCPGMGIWWCPHCRSGKP